MHRDVPFKRPFLTTSTEQATKLILVLSLLKDISCPIHLSQVKRNQLLAFCQSQLINSINCNGCQQINSLPFIWPRFITNRSHYTRPNWSKRSIVSSSYGHLSWDCVWYCDIDQMGAFLDRKLLQKKKKMICTLFEWYQLFSKFDRVPSGSAEHLEHINMGDMFDYSFGLIETGLAQGLPHWYSQILIVTCQYWPLRYSF